jgi:hypothetical protein
MAYEGERRITIYNLIASALSAKLYFGAVKKQLPETAPANIDTLEGKPQAFVALLPETIAGITNKEREADMRVAIVLFVRAEKDVDLEKLRAQNVAERAINNLQTDANFTAVGSLIHVQNIDPGPLALSVFGLDWAVLPPFGVVRLDVLANFIYQAID